MEKSTIRFGRFAEARVSVNNEGNPSRKYAIQGELHVGRNGKSLSAATLSSLNDGAAYATFSCGLTTNNGLTATFYDNDPDRRMELLGEITAFIEALEASGVGLDDFKVTE